MDDQGNLLHVASHESSGPRSTRTMTDRGVDQYNEGRDARLVNLERAKAEHDHEIAIGTKCSENIKLLHQAAKNITDTMSVTNLRLQNLSISCSVQRRRIARN
jgi:hypothetical protein